MSRARIAPGAHSNVQGRTSAAAWRIPTGTTLEEHRFARHVAAALEQLVRTRNVKALVVAAPPRTLADLRRAFHADVSARIIAEVDKDLTKHPVAEIEKHLAG